MLKVCCTVSVVNKRLSKAGKVSEKSESLETGRKEGI